MRIIGVNGSPRKTWNTARMLGEALQGAVGQGAQTETVHLYDFSYKGCVSCFACKTIGGKSYGRCAQRDGLSSLLERLTETNGFILASPIYYGTVTGEMRSFMERLFFPFMTYTDPPESLFPRKIRTGLICTLGATEEMAVARGFDRHIALMEFYLQLIFGSAETVCSFDTYQFEDYTKVFAPRWDPAQKKKRRAEVFPIDLKNAFELGARLAGKQA